MDENPVDPNAVAVADDAADRQDSRDSLFLMADFRVAGSEELHPVRVRNLSASGLMAEFPAGLEQGTRVDIGVRGIGRVLGQIAWSDAGRIGLTFDHPIDPLRARKPVGQGGHTPTFVKPVLARNHLR